jgi:hypothetical protein
MRSRDTLAKYQWSGHQQNRQRLRYLHSITTAERHAKFPSCSHRIAKIAMLGNSFDAITWSQYIRNINDDENFEPFSSCFNISVCVAKVTSIVKVGIKML